MTKILFIRQHDPSSIQQGGDRGCQQNLLALQKVWGKENVIEYTLCHNSSSPKSLFLKSILQAHKGRYGGWNAQQEKEILQLAHHCQAVFIDRSLFGVLAQRLRKDGYKGRIAVFFHNVEYQYYRARFPKHFPLKKFLLRCISHNEAMALQYANLRIAINERDATQILEKYRQKVDAIRTVQLPDIQPNTPNTPCQSPPQLLFVGSNFPANEKGIRWFVEEVFPHIECQLLIVGKNIDSWIKFAQHPRIQIHANVPDLSPFYENADIVVLPIFEGSGMKVKTAEALMYGKNILGTTEAFQGYELPQKDIAIECHTANEFILHLKQNPFAQKFNPKARSLYLQNHESSHEFEQLLLSWKEKLPETCPIPKT